MILATKGKVLSKGVMCASSSLSNSVDTCWDILDSNSDVDFRVLWLVIMVGTGGEDVIRKGAGQVDEKEDDGHWQSHDGVERNAEALVKRANRTEEKSVHLIICDCFFPSL